MTTLVLYDPKTNELKLWSTAHWPEEPFTPWRTLEFALSYGLIVIGEL